MKQNLGTGDRVLRIFLAFGFAILYFSGNVDNMIVANMLWLVGLTLFVTGIIGTCPLYALLGFRTNRVSKKKLRKG